MPNGTRRSPLAGSRYYNQFIKSIKGNHNLELDLEEYPEDLYVDKKLGLRLYHGELNQYDNVHYRHQVYIIVSSHGKAAKVKLANSIVASVLATQRTSKAELCSALETSVRKEGKRVVAGREQQSKARCADCGHDTYWDWDWYKTGFIFKDIHWYVRSVCCPEDESTPGNRICCKCSGAVAAIDSKEAADSPEDKPNILSEQEAVQLILSSTNQTGALQGQDGTITYNNWNVHVDRAVFVNAQDMGAQVGLDGVRPGFTIDNVVGSFDTLALQDNAPRQGFLEEIVDEARPVEDFSPQARSVPSGGAVGSGHDQEDLRGS
ncbi:hypothetical protein BKA64DRAFT_721120 [Cadophora sp. MPI-SDFR-AT-0126]|nr:hypothetical protein BKA64DRAFT_721120 [Leotiomycetes sp. MPI-SDFR-AT-0126]